MENLQVWSKQRDKDSVDVEHPHTHPAVAGRIGRIAGLGARLGDGAP